MADTFSDRFRIPLDSPVSVKESEGGQVSFSVPRTAPKEKKDRSHEEVQEFLTLARKRFLTCSESESTLRYEQQVDQRFMASEQWPDQVRAMREQDGRPCLTVNRLPVFKRQVTNQQRQSKPSVQINPVDSGGDPKTAEVFQGIIRHIEIKSAADVAYDTACDHQVTIGRGYFRVVVEWSETDPWRQEIFIRRIKNPFLVYFDPSCQEADYSDARYAFIIEDVPMEEFTFRYGKEKADTASYSGQFTVDGADRSSDWMPEGKVRVAEYFYVDTTREEVSLLSNGVEMPKAAADSAEMKQLMATTGITVLRSRKVERKMVKWAKITGSQILEEREWLGRWIPVIPVLGDEVDVNGKVDLRGMVRDARDPQRMYNYWVSAETEAIALAPKAPIIMAEGQIAGHEDKWRLANQRNYPYLLYKPFSLTNTLVPPPQRQQAEPPIAAITAATRQADNDLKAVTGLYDASLGERGPEESARAILARQRQGDLSNSHWVDNLMRAIRCLGKQLIDLIPKVYDVPRVMRIIGVDNQPRMVMVHAGNPPSQQEQEMMQGIQGVYDLSAGEYDVTVSVGPSYQSRRQEAVVAMTEFMRAFPPAAPVLGDLMAENMDWPGASQAAKRLRKMVPAQVLDDEDKPQVPPEAQQKMAEQDQMIQTLQAELAKREDIIKGQVVQGQSREKVAMIQIHGQMALEALRSKTAQGTEIAKMHVEKMRAMMEMDLAKQQAVVDAGIQRSQQQIDAEGEQLKVQIQAMADLAQQREEFRHEDTMQMRDHLHERNMAYLENEQARTLESMKLTTTKEIEKQRADNSQKLEDKRGSVALKSAKLRPAAKPAAKKASKKR